MRLSSASTRPLRRRSARRASSKLGRADEAVEAMRRGVAEACDGSTSLDLVASAPARGPGSASSFHPDSGTTERLKTSSPLTGLVHHASIGLSLTNAPGPDRILLAEEHSACRRSLPSAFTTLASSTRCMRTFISSPTMTTPGSAWSWSHRSPTANPQALTADPRTGCPFNRRDGPASRRQYDCGFGPMSLLSRRSRSGPHPAWRRRSNRRRRSRSSPSPRRRIHVSIRSVQTLEEVVPLHVVRP